jgi:leader peptidase (prepilin peptidase)/N-methyltransferase
VIARVLSAASSSLWTFVAWGAIAIGVGITSLRVAPGLAGLLGAGLGFVMIAIAAFDARYFIIPNKFSGAAVALGLAAATTAQEANIAASVVSAILRGIILASLFYAFRLLYRSLRGREGMGLGDVKLAGVAGVWLGWIAVALAIDIAALAALGMVLLGALRGHRFTGSSKVPFGLFFAPAIWVGWLIQVVLVQPRF